MKEIRAEAIESQFNIAIVISQFNELVTKRLYDCALTRLEVLSRLPWWNDKGFKNFDYNLYGINIKYFG